MTWLSCYLLLVVCQGHNRLLGRKTANEVHSRGEMCAAVWSMFKNLQTSDVQSTRISPQLVNPDSRSVSWPGLAGQTGFTQFVFDMKTDCREQLEHMVALGYQDWVCPKM